jgi:hypothetical protein
MRHLDRTLDRALEEAYAAVSRRRWMLSRTEAADMRRIAELQVDNAMLFEGVNNVLKLLGDQYLARLNRLAAQRFHLAEWDTTILRKLGVLEGIYDKISDRVAARRMEILEWIIIVLIAVSIALPFMTGSGH